VLGACSSDDDSGGGTPNAGNGDRIVQAFSAGRDPGFTAGKVERISISDGDLRNGEYTATLSDITINTDGTSIYQIGRFQLDNITKYSPLDTMTAPLYQRSVAGAEANANPYQIVFVSDTKAYLIRFGSDKIWIINPSAATEAEFKTGELDLSAYNDADGSPEPNAGVVIGDRLFVSMARLENFAVTQGGYLAVFDTTTDTELDTGQGAADSLPGIPLTVRNPTALQYLAADGLLYVAGMGSLFGEPAPGMRFTGGIETIDATSFATNLVLDDGNDEQNQGQFTDLLVLSASKAYVLTYASFGDTTLRNLNLMTGSLDDAAVAGLQNMDITTLAQGPRGRVWIGVNETPNPGYQLVDPAADAQTLKKVITDFIPQAVVFITSDRSEENPVATAGVQ